MALNGGGNTDNLLYMIRSLQQSVVAQIAKEELDEFHDPGYLLETTINLGFINDFQISHALALILNKVLKTDTLGIFDEPKYKNLEDLIVLVSQFLMDEQAEVNSYLLKASV